MGPDRDLQRLELHSEQALKEKGRVPGVRLYRPCVPGWARHGPLAEEILRALSKVLFGGAYAEGKHPPSR
jgi:hypothetical protein